MKTITFYSYKGGVGRSLALSNVANRLSEFGKKVCIMDFDLEAPGLHLKFGDHISFQGVNNGIVDYIDSYTRTGIVPEDINDFVTYISFADSDRRRPIALIAAGDTRSKQYWSKVCAIDWKKFFYQKDSTGVEFFSNLKEQIREQVDPDFLLIDSRTGITDISGVTMSIMADEVVLLAANNRENLEGITQIIKTLSVPENFLGGNIPKINFVLSRIPYFTSPKDKPKEANAKNNALFRINKELIDTGFEKFQLNKIMVIHSDPELELEESFKIAHKYEQEKEGEVSVIGLDYLDLFEEITEGMISKSEKKTFELFMRVQSLVQRAKAAKDFSSRMRLLEEAIAIDPSSATAYSQMGMTYFHGKEYDKALKCFDKASALDPSIEILQKLYVGISYQQIGRHDKALEEFKELQQFLPEDPFILSGMSRSYYVKGDFQMALDFADRALKNSPGSEDYWNMIGNIQRRLGNYDEAFKGIYKALEINPQSRHAIGSLAEIYAEVGNDWEFYKNLEQSFSFGMNTDLFQKILEEEPVYRRFYSSERFLSILDKYGIEINWERVLNNQNKKLKKK